MEDPFNPGEKVVCISDRCTCCGRKIPVPYNPTVGDVYEVWEVGFYYDEKNNRVLSFITKGMQRSAAWPQCNFKRIPPQVVERDKKVSEPVT
jgi:hypothetical protein